MIFSRLGRSLSRSSRNLLHGDLRLGTLYGVSRTNVYIDDVEKGLGFLRGYVSSAIARNNEFASNLHDFKSIAANPKLHRLFSSESPKKKKESKSNTEDGGSFQEAFMKEFQNYLSPLLVVGLFLSILSFGPREHQQVSFQESINKLLEPGVSNKSVAKIYTVNYQTFEKKFLEPGLVDGIVVNIPLSVAKIYLKNSLDPIFMYIGSDILSLEEKLKKSQEALGIDFHNFVPLWYFIPNPLRFAPALLVLGFLFALLRTLVKFFKR